MGELKSDHDETSRHLRVDQRPTDERRMAALAARRELLALGIAGIVIERMRAVVKGRVVQGRPVAGTITFRGGLKLEWRDDGGSVTFHEVKRRKRIGQMFSDAHRVAQLKSGLAVLKSKGLV